jgi:hypothetical protein
MTELLELLLRFREIPGLNLGLVTGHQDCDFRGFAHLIRKNGGREN